MATHQRDTGKNKLMLRNLKAVDGKGLGKMKSDSSEIPAFILNRCLALLRKAETI